jgi:hypothetical protein
MRFLHSSSLLKNIGFVTASHLSINSETRLADRESQHRTRIGLVILLAKTAIQN